MLDTVTRPFSRTTLLGLGLLLLLAGACGPADTGSNEPADEATTAETSAPEQTPDTDWIGGVTLGTDVGADGTVPADAATDRVPVGETAFVSVRVTRQPAGAELRVTFWGPDGQVVAEDGKRVSPDADAVFVSSGPTGEWSTGPYRAEVWVGDEKVVEHRFELVAGS